jgi:hypothetical protein
MNIALRSAAPSGAPVRRPRRILLVFKQAPWIAEHILPSFAGLQAEVEQFDFRNAGDPLWHDLVQMALKARIRSRRFDLVFMIEAMDDLIDPEIAADARRGGALVCNLLVDVPQEWWRSLEIAGCCQLTLAAQAHNAERLTRAGANVAHFPFAVSEQFARDALAHVSRPLAASDLGLPLFVGSAHSRWRRQLVATLDQAGIALDVIGGGWTGTTIGSAGAASPHALRADWRHQWERLCGSGLAPLAGGALNRLLPPPPRAPMRARFHGFLDRRRMMDVATRATLQVSTAIHGSGHLVGRPSRQVKLRDVESLCLGAPYLTDAGEEAAAFAADGDLLVPYRSATELPGLIADIAADPLAWRRGGPAQSAHILANHTWRQRFAEISNLTGMSLVPA